MAAFTDDELLDKIEVDVGYDSWKWKIGDTLNLSIDDSPRIHCTVVDKRGTCLLLKPDCSQSHSVSRRRLYGQD